MSDYLFSMPKFIDGVASVVDIFGTYTIYNNSKSNVDTDRRALVADIQTLKKDACVAFAEVKELCLTKGKN